MKIYLIISLIIALPYSTFSMLKDAQELEQLLHSNESLTDKQYMQLNFKLADLAQQSRQKCPPRELEPLATLAVLICTRLEQSELFASATSRSRNKSTTHPSRNNFEAMLHLAQSQKMQADSTNENLAAPLTIPSSVTSSSTAAANDSSTSGLLNWLRSWITRN